MPERRQLQFDSLGEAVADAEKLLARGYERAGNWSLSQVCDHMADWLTFPLDGFPKAPFPISAMLWVMKKTVGRKKFESYLSTRSFPAGKPTMPQTRHNVGDDSVAVARLKAAA